MGPSPPFRGIFLQQPDGSLRQVGITVVEGGNPDLLAETADTQSLGLTVSPTVVPNLTLHATWSDVRYQNRINRLANFIVDPDNLPSDIIYIPETDEYIQERRWINVSSVDRNGIDFSARWTPSTNEYGDFDIRVRHSIINSYDYIIDPDDPENNAVISVVGETDGSTAIGVVSKSSSNVNIGWYNLGFEFNVDLTRRSNTKATFTGVTREYEPPILVDVSLTYNITPEGFIGFPAFLDDGRVTVLYNNVLDSYGSTSVTNSAGEKLQPTSPDASPLYGRVFNISVYLPL